MKSADRGGLVLVASRNLTESHKMNHASSDEESFHATVNGFSSYIQRTLHPLPLVGHPNCPPLSQHLVDSALRPRRQNGELECANLIGCAVAAAIFPQEHAAIAA